LQKIPSNKHKKGHIRRVCQARIPMRLTWLPSYFPNASYFTLPIHKKTDYIEVLAGTIYIFLIYDTIFLINPQNKQIARMNRIIFRFYKELHTLGRPAIHTAW